MRSAIEFTWRRLVLRWAGLGLALLAWVAPASGQKFPPPTPQVSRGPYLQIGTPTSVVVRWRTGIKTPSVVYYSADPAHLTRMAISPGRLTEHVVLLSNLQPDTQYFYAVGTSTNRVAVSSGIKSFRTAPANETTPVRVWVLGDPGTGYPVQYAIRDAFKRAMGATPPSFILTLGDNAYRNGTDAQYQRFFFHVYREQFAHSVVWPAFGNHDARSADSATESGVYYNIFTLPRLGQAGGIPSGTEAYYSFDYANAHFICLNSQDSDLSPEGAMLSWLERDLAASGKEWTIAYWHHPPYSKGAHDSDDGKENDLRMVSMRERVLPILEAAGVDLVLCGHSHLYERSFPLRGHYGRSSTLQPEMILDRGDGQPRGSGPYHKFGRGPHARGGTVYVTAGSAGHTTRERDLHGLNHPVMAVSLNVPGSFVLDIRGSEVRGVFLDDRGRRRDEFVISKRR